MNIQSHSRQWLVKWKQPSSLLNPLFLHQNTGTSQFVWFYFYLDVWKTKTKKTKTRPKATTNNIKTSHLKPVLCSSILPTPEDLTMSFYPVYRSVSASASAWSTTRYSKKKKKNHKTITRQSQCLSELLWMSLLKVRESLSYWTFRSLSFGSADVSMWT